MKVIEERALFKMFVELQRRGLVLSQELFQFFREAAETFVEDSETGFLPEADQKAGQA